MQGRGEKKIVSDRAGPLTYVVFQSSDVKPRYYLVAVAVKEDAVYVIETFFPHQKAYDKHRKAVIASFGTFRIK